MGDERVGMMAGELETNGDFDSRLSTEDHGHCQDGDASDRMLSPIHTALT